jgi:hypothetical protein
MSVDESKTDCLEDGLIIFTPKFFMTNDVIEEMITRENSSLFPSMSVKDTAIEILSVSSRFLGQ